MASKEGRARFAGDVCDLVAAMKPHVKSKGFLQYSESLKSKVDGKEICRHGPLVQSLHGLQANLSFKKTTLELAFKEIAREKALKLESGEQADWAKYMDQRLRVMLRHIAQNKDRSKAAWVVAIFGDDAKQKTSKSGGKRVAAVKAQEPSAADDEEDEEEQEQAEEEEAEEGGDAEHVEDEEPDKDPVEDVSDETGDDTPQGGVTKPSTTGGSSSSKAVPAMKRPAAATLYFYGWDTEYQNAWRTLPDGSPSSRQFTDDLFAMEGSNDMSPMWARWPDGDQHVITDLVVGTWKAMEETKKDMKSRGRGSGKTPLPKLWEGVHVKTQFAVTVARRADRRPLTSIKHNGKQIMQVSEIHVAGDMEKADVIAIELAKMFASDSVQADKMQAERDALLVKNGFKAKAARREGGEPRTKKAKKKPAADAPVSVSPVGRSEHSTRELSTKKGGPKETPLKRPAAAPVASSTLPAAPPPVQAPQQAAAGQTPASTSFDPLLFLSEGPSTSMFDDFWTAARA